MAYRNVKIDFEYKGTEYPGFAYQDGVELKLGSLKIDGFPELSVFINADKSPSIAISNAASISSNAAPTSGYLVIDYVAPPP